MSYYRIYYGMEKEYLYLLLGFAGLAIVALIATVLYYRRRLLMCKTSLIRCINENIEIKQKLPEQELPHFISRDELTAEEFTSIIHNMLKRLMFIASFILIIVSPVFAQNDSVYTFRFQHGSNMFYGSKFKNNSELKRLEECIGAYRPNIDSGLIPIYVDGYCNSALTEARNLSIAKVRANRVKSELIVRDDLKEEYFITHNHPTDGDFVTVRIIIPRTNVAVNNSIAGQDKPITALTLTEEADTTHIIHSKAEPENDVHGLSGTETPPMSIEPQTNCFYQFSIRANLLRWATLTPDLGIEWRINRNAGILVNGSWTSWSWNDKERRYALWEIAPELRWYIGKDKRGYIGVMFKTGEFNYKLSETGRQGDIIGGGITGGYLLKLNNVLSLDFSLGVGCLRADYSKYMLIDGVRVRHGKENKNWWGPTSTGVTLVWSIF